MGHYSRAHLSRFRGVADRVLVAMLDVNEVCVEVLDVLLDAVWVIGFDMED